MQVCGQAYIDGAGMNLQRVRVKNGPQPRVIRTPGVSNSTFSIIKLYADKKRVTNDILMNRINQSGERTVLR